MMNINFNHPQFKYINTTTSNDSSSIDEIPIGKEIILPERVSYSNNNIYSETYAYDIIEGIILAGYSCGAQAGEYEDYEEGQIINKTFYCYDMLLIINEYSAEDKYIYEKWDKMVMYREELKVKLNEVTQCIPAYDGIIPPQNLNGVIEGFRLLDC